MPDTERNLDEFIRRSTEVEVPAQVEARLRRRLAEFREKVEQRPPSRLRMLVYALAHPSSHRLPAMAAATLAISALALVYIFFGSHASRVYAAAVAQLRAAQSLEYTVVLAPYTEVEFSYLAPGFRRINCSWGVEMRTDGAGKQLILMHATRNYLMERTPQADGLASAMDMVEQFKSLPQTADETLGEERAGGKRLMDIACIKRRPAAAFPGSRPSICGWMRERGAPTTWALPFRNRASPSIRCASGTSGWARQ